MFNDTKIGGCDPAVTQIEVQTRETRDLHAQIWSNAYYIKMIADGHYTTGEIYGIAPEATYDPTIDLLFDDGDAPTVKRAAVGKQVSA